MKKFKGYFQGLLSATFYGLIPLFIIPVKQMGFSVDTTLLYRFGIAAAMVFLILLFKRESLRITRKQLVPLLSLGALYGISSDLLFLGYDYSTPGIASTIFFLFPVLVALISFFFFHEKLTKRTFVALFLTLAGVYVLSVQGSGFHINLLGVLIPAGAALGYALYILIVKHADLDISAWKMAFYSFFFAAIYYLIKTSILGDPVVLPNLELLGNFALFALITTVISTVTLIHATKLIGPTPVSIMGAMEPIVAVLVSVVLFGEPFTYRLAAGAVLIITGVVISMLRKRQRHPGSLQQKSTSAV